MNFKILVYVFVYVRISMWSNKRMLNRFCLFMVAYNCRLYIQNTNTIQRVRRVLYLLLTTVTAPTSRKQITYSESNTQPTIYKTLFSFAKRLAKCQHTNICIFFQESSSKIIILWFTYTKIVYFFYFFDVNIGVFSIHHLTVISFENEHQQVWQYLLYVLFDNWIFLFHINNKQIFSNHHNYTDFWIHWNGKRSI